MTGEQPKPWAGTILALIGGGAMLSTGSDPLLVLGIVVLWSASLWLFRHEPPTPLPDIDTAQIVAATREAVLEAVGIPLILIERGRIAAANAPARAALGEHILGQDARIAFRHPDAMQLLDRDEDGSVSVSGFLGSRTLWQLTRRRIDAGACLIELLDRTSEADVSRAQTDFVANASHELRTPLAAIIGYVETLQDSGADIDATTRERFHATVLREARRMQALVSDLMSLSQVEAEKHDLPDQTVDLVRLVERVAGEAQAIAGRDRISMDLAGGPVDVRGDRTQLEQLVRNLIDNALKYGDAQRPVRITLRTGTRRGVDLLVADEGAGIAPEHLPHLTRRFYRTDPGRSRGAGGTGLGLAIVKHIVERHRGQLDIASTLGVGTTVTVALPVPTAAVAPPAAGLS
ncbi:sensor histidine kinase [Novosphingobium aerophilum]|uniref:histidine kinase n=1 Tax=Novosphingobium aerophilum TaxID=2839843 RepID=A0A7X1F590_9SPHN|nr:ATP-binding protein [Novosphingobium aerophilum]MBC2650573.1 two-component sensor histidine kinase [Novosphingobium aerophilum]